MVRRVLPLLLMLVPVAAQAATVTIKVENVGSKGGTLRLSLYDKASWSKEPDAPLASADVPATAPETTVTLKDVEPGVYGIKTFQDANDNGKFDQGLFGYPLERYGFSRNAVPFFSLPAFSRARFTVEEGENEITIRLR